jgi:uracil-DNA glycosylase family 4
MTRSTTDGPASALEAADPSHPGRDCPLCPRLVAFRHEAQLREPTWFNAPVPAFGDPAGRLLIVGLAPGLQGANRTGRPFTGDYAGDLLYSTLLAYGFATGRFEARIDDTLDLTGGRIVNAVRCVPPQNKPTPAEIATCRPFFLRAMEAMPNLRAVVALGRIAHDTTLRALGVRAAQAKFAHGAIHPLGRFTLYDSYHCSRYNTNTGVLTTRCSRVSGPTSTQASAGWISANRGRRPRSGPAGRRDRKRG